MTRMASYDTLTGLPNRTLLNLRMTNLLERQNRDAGRFAVLSLDLDRFKNVNDTLGHEVGDRLLVEVARRIGAVLRARDIAARFGGDEFVILQANVSQPSDASALARRVIDSLGAPYDIEGHRILVGAITVKRPRNCCAIPISPSTGPRPTARGGIASSRRR